MCSNIPKNNLTPRSSFPVGKITLKHWESFKTVFLAVEICTGGSRSRDVCTPYIIAPHAAPSKFAISYEKYRTSKIHCQSSQTSCCKAAKQHGSATKSHRASKLQGNANMQGPSQSPQTIPLPLSRHYHRFQNPLHGKNKR